MARGTPLLQLVEYLREEVGRASSTAVGTSDLPGLKQKLRRTQELLYDDYDWPHLRALFTIQLATATQFYSVPEGLHFERIEDAFVNYNNLAQPLTRGIGIPDYNVYNSPLGIQSEPAMKWDVRAINSSEQIEIWPLPSTNNQVLSFTGIRNLNPLVTDDDAADLDDHLIVLWCAAEILSRQGSNSAGLVTKLAQNRLGTIKKRTKGAERTVRMGMGAATSDPRLPIVVHARAP